MDDKKLIPSAWTDQWQRKAIALFAAIVIWLSVDHSITSTKTIPNVPVRMIDLPSNQTVQGLLSTGFLQKRIPLTLTGTKDVIEQLEPGDVEVVVDVATLPSESAVQITKKQVVSLNPNLVLSKHLTAVAHPELIIKMSPLLTESVPVTILPPQGHPPEGYEMLDVWPIHLEQTVTGPQEAVLALKHQGISVSFSLDEISKETLDELAAAQNSEDEVIFPIPEKWKRIVIPFLGGGSTPLNDPRQQRLVICFLKETFFPLEQTIPLHPFYPIKTSASVNPETYPLVASRWVATANDIPRLILPLFAHRVSKRFLNAVKEDLEIDLIIDRVQESQPLGWNVHLLHNPNAEERFVKNMISLQQHDLGDKDDPINPLDTLYRQRFTAYSRRLQLYSALAVPLNLHPFLSKGALHVMIPTNPDP